MWLCTRNPLINDAITDNRVFVNNYITVHASNTNKVSIPMFSWSVVTVSVLKSLPMKENALK